LKIFDENLLLLKKYTTILLLLKKLAKDFMLFWNSIEAMLLFKKITIEENQLFKKFTRELLIFFFYIFSFAHHHGWRCLSQITPR
jgi:hypothetical protein